MISSRVISTLLLFKLAILCGNGFGEQASLGQAPAVPTLGASNLRITDNILTWNGPPGQLYEVSISGAERIRRRPLVNAIDLSFIPRGAPQRVTVRPYNIVKNKQFRVAANSTSTTLIWTGSAQRFGVVIAALKDSSSNTAIRVDVTVFERAYTHPRRILAGTYSVELSSFGDDSTVRTIEHSLSLPEPGSVESRLGIVRTPPRPTQFGESGNLFEVGIALCPNVVMSRKTLTPSTSVFVFPEIGVFQGINAEVDELNPQAPWFTPAEVIPLTGGLSPFNLLVLSSPLPNVSGRLSIAPFPSTNIPQAEIVYPRGDAAAFAYNRVAAVVARPIFDRSSLFINGIDAKSKSATTIPDVRRAVPYYGALVSESERRQLLLTGLPVITTQGLVGFTENGARLDIPVTGLKLTPFGEANSSSLAEIRARLDSNCIAR